MSYQAVFKRYELKYVLSPSQYEAVMDVFGERMKLDSYGKTQIHNIYCDTGDFLLARRSIEKPFYKEKLRIRSYGSVSEDDDVFVEIKKKYDGVVYKRRLTMPYRSAMEWLETGRNPLERSQIGDEIDYMLSYYGGLRPMMGLDYVRRAYYPVDGSDFRVTIDEDITASCEDISLGREGYGFKLLPEGYHLMEVKTPGSIPLWMTEVMCDDRIWKTSFSKYGNAYKQMVMGHTLSDVTGLTIEKEAVADEN